MPDLPALPADQREIAVQRLSALFAAGQIELDELERRLDIAVRAQNAADLGRALAGLPDTVAPEAESKAIARTGPQARGSRWSVAVLSGQHRRGPWTVGPEHRALAFWGGAIIDLRDAVLTADVTHLRARAIMGGIQVIVPPDMPVEVTGFGVMGSVDNKSGDVPGPPRVVVHAFALWGGVQVVARERGEDIEGRGRAPERRRIEG